VRPKITYVYPVILIDNRNNSDPYIHAAIEEYMVRHMQPASENLVMLYVNSPCVVVGKNQCIYREVNYEYLREEKAVVRRISGGGTVYHDDGNLCFAFLSKFDDKKVNNYKYFNQPIVDILQKAGIDAQFNDRNDILWNGKKISGNAQFTDRKNILSHGTILVNADLAKLRYALKENPFTVETKAVSSVRSSVMNISDGSDRFKTAVALKEHLLKELPITSTISFTDEEWKQINESADKQFKSFEWIWGRNPQTKIISGEMMVEIENGIVIRSSDAGLVGRRYTRPLLVA
jgi:lipoate-protein ligase A